MLLGVDLDNTLINYDGIFHDVAVAWGMMPQDGPSSKRGVREWLIEKGREEDFILLQGHVYGPGLEIAKPYPGALDCLRELAAAGVAVRIVSHKTRTPHRGPQHDLHRMALEWLRGNAFISPSLLRREDVFLEETLEAKAERASRLECTHFVDDMERFFTHPAFPEATERLLFRPAGSADGIACDGMRAFSSWVKLREYLHDGSRGG